MVCIYSGYVCLVFVWWSGKKCDKYAKKLRNEILFTYIGHVTVTVSSMLQTAKTPIIPWHSETSEQCRAPWGRGKSGWSCDAPSSPCGLSAPPKFAAPQPELWDCPPGSVGSPWCWLTCRHAHTQITDFFHFDYTIPLSQSWNDSALQTNIT